MNTIKAVLYIMKNKTRCYIVKNSVRQPNNHSESVKGSGNDSLRHIL